MKGRMRGGVIAIRAESLQRLVHGSEITPAFQAVRQHCPRTAAARSATGPSASPATLRYVAPFGRPSSRLSYSAPRSASRAAEGAAELSPAEVNFANQPVDGGRCKGGDSGRR